MVRGRQLIRVILGVAGVLGVVVAAVLITPLGQTWLARRALASRPDWHATLESARLGWGWVEVRNLAWRKGPVAVRVPAAKADFALWSRLISGRWELESVRVSAAEVIVTEPVEPLLPTVGGLLESISRGFGAWELPLALEVGQIEVAGTVRAPGWPAAASLQIKGVGPSLGRDAKLELEVQAETGDPAVSKVGASGTLTFRLRSARRPDLLAFEGEVKAQGTRWPQPVRVSLALSASDHGTYQDYRGTCWTDERPLVAWGARMTDAAMTTPARMSGTWMFDVREGDLAPLLPGSPLSAVTVRSEGSFAAEAPFSGFDFEGEWQIACAQPRRIWPQWSSDFPARAEGRFRLRQSSETSQLKALTATLEAGDARATLAIERDLEVRWPEGVSNAASSAERLGTLELRHWPWALLPAELGSGEVLALGALNGRLGFWPRLRGWFWRSEGALVTDPLTSTVAITGVCRDLQAKADVTLQWLKDGWQLEATRLSLAGSGGEFAQGEFKSGRLNDAGQPLKLAGKLSLDLGRLGKSGARPGIGWKSGELTAELAASLGQVRGWRAQFESRGGVFQQGANEFKVPPVKLDARVETDATGRLVFDFPLTLGEGAMVRDVRAAGTLRPSAAGDGWEASVSGQRVLAEDLSMIANVGGLDEGGLGRLLREDGRLGLRFGRVGLPGKADLQAFEADLVVRQAMGALTAKAAWSEGGQIALKAEVRPHASEVRIAGEVSVQQMAAGELWGMAGRFGKTPVEGACDGSLRFEGTLTSPLADHAGLELVSRGGVFHGLPVSFVRVAESTNRLTSWIASAGLAFNALTGRSTEAEIAGRSQAVAELVRGLNPVNYDQFTVRAERGAAGKWRVRELALITPELRLLGDGTVGVAVETAPPLALDLQLRARGRTAELLQYLGVLQEQRDSLGYAGCALPVRLSGTLARPEALELNQHLAALSIEKAGMVDKALEFLGRWRSHGGDGLAKP